MDAPKTIACDVNGVVADFLSVWLAKYNEEWNDDLRVDEITAWNTDKFVRPECGLLIYKYLDNPSLYDYVEPYDGALACIEKLKRFGYRVVWATSSPIKSFGRKFYWLEEHGFIHSLKDYFETNDKSLVRADIIIDDYFKNLDIFCGKKILFRRPWNKYIDDNYYFAKSYNDVVRYCSE